MWGTGCGTPGSPLDYHHRSDSRTGNRLTRPHDGREDEEALVSSTAGGGSTQTGPANDVAERLGLSTGMVVQELGWDSDSDDELRVAVENAIDAGMVDPDKHVQHIDYHGPTILTGMEFRTQKQNALSTKWSVAQRTFVHPVGINELKLRSSVKKLDMCNRSLAI